MNDMETIKELQQDLPLGSRVRITLTNGKEQEGVLQSIGLDHIGIKKDDGYRAKIKTVMLGASQVIPSLVSGAPSSEEASTASGVPPSQKPASEAPSPASTELEKSNLSSARKAAGRASSAPKDAKETLNQEVTDEPSPPPIPLEIERQLMQIEIGLGERIKNACLEITPPNFGALPLKDLTDSSFKKTWHKITERYGYASSVNELDRKFGRTQQIAHQLRLLKEEYSSLPHLRPRLAHLYYLQGQPNDALAELEWEVKYFRGSLEDSTLLNAAAIASEKGAALKALWFLELCFSHGNPGRYPQAWLVLLGLALKTQNIAVLAKIEQAKRVVMLRMQNGTSKSPFCPRLSRRLFPFAAAALRPGHYVNPSQARIRLRTPTSNGSTAFRMPTLHPLWRKARRVCCERPTPTADYQPSFHSPWLAAIAGQSQTTF